MTDITSTANLIITSILPAEAEVSVTSREENDMTIIEVKAKTEFLGQLIGKEGKIIKAIRTLLNLAFPETRYQLDIKE